MKKTILSVVLLTLVAFVFGAMAAAPPKTETTPAPAPATPAETKPMSPAKLEKFSGELKSVDAMAKSFVVAKGKEEKTIVVNDNTKITKAKKDLTFADLKAGMSIVVGYKKEMDKNMAATIKVAAPKAPAKK
jgi:hypothetical protein